MTTNTDKIDTGWHLAEQWEGDNTDPRLDEFVLRCSVCWRKLTAPEKATAVMSVCGGDIRIWDEAAAAEQQPWQAEHAVPISEAAPFGWLTYGWDSEIPEGKRIDGDFMGLCLVGPECRKKYDRRLYMPAELIPAIIEVNRRSWERAVERKRQYDAHCEALRPEDRYRYGWSKCTLEVCSVCEQEERQRAMAPTVALPPLPPVEMRAF